MRTFIEQKLTVIIGDCAHQRMLCKLCYQYMIKCEYEMQTMLSCDRKNRTINRTLAAIGTTEHLVLCNSYFLIESTLIYLLQHASNILLWFASLWFIDRISYIKIFYVQSLIKDLQRIFKILIAQKFWIGVSEVCVFKLRNIFRNVLL